MLKKGDVVSVSYRKGYDKQGNPVMETLDRYSFGFGGVNACLVLRRS